MKIEIDYDRKTLTFNGQPFSFNALMNFTEPTADQIFLRVGKENGHVIVQTIHVDKDMFDFIMTRERR